VSPGSTLLLNSAIKSKEDIPSIQELPLRDHNKSSAAPGASRPAAIVPPYPTLNLYDFVDVRMIDFAHSTHRGLKDSTIHEGPDQGFLFGLDNFIEILNELAL
jgi:hypothetical protein